MRLKLPADSAAPRASESPRASATDIASSDFARQVSDNRGVQIGNLLPQTPGRVVQQGCRETLVDIAAADIVAADLAAPRDLLGDG